MKEFYVIRKDSVYLWEIKGNRVQWGSKYGSHLKEFKTFDEAKKALDNLPLHEYMGFPYFEIVKLFKK